MLNRGMLTAIYTLTVALGVVTLLFPAPSIEGVIGYAFAYTYGFLLLIGGLAALVAVVLPNYKIEYGALWLVTGGYGIYATALWALFAERLAEIGDQALPPPYGPAIALTVLTLFLAAKMMFLAKKNGQLIRASEHGMG